MKKYLKVCVGLNRIVMLISAPVTLAQGASRSKTLRKMTRSPPSGSHHATLGAIQVNHASASCCAFTNAVTA